MAQTTEERIAQIAQGFGRGIQNFQQGQDKQRSQGLQDEARKRQQAMQSIDIANTLGAQSGRNIDASAIQTMLSSGDLQGIGQLLQSSPVSDKFQAEQGRLDRGQKLQDLQFQKLQNDLGQAALPFEQSREGQKLAFQADVASNRAGKITKDMRTVGTFASRLGESEDVFSGLVEGGFNRASQISSAASGLPGFLQGTEQKKQDQAERNFVNATLRRESGAAISESEFTSAEIQYFPRAGDDAAVLSQKARNRATIRAGFEVEAGDKAMAEIAARRGQFVDAIDRGGEPTQLFAIGGEAPGSTPNAQNIAGFNPLQSANAGQGQLSGQSSQALDLRRQELLRKAGQ